MYNRMAGHASEHKLLSSHLGANSIITNDGDGPV